MRKLFDAPYDAYRVTDPDPTAGSGPGRGRRRGRRTACARTSSAMLGDPDVVLGRAIDLVRFATDASPYRMFPKVVVLARAVEDIQRVLRLRQRARDPDHLPGGGHQPVRSGAGRRHPRRGHAATGSAAPSRTTGRALRSRPGTILAGPTPPSSPTATGSARTRARRRRAPSAASIANNASGMCCGMAENSYRTLRSMKFVLPSGTVVDTGAADAEEQLAAGRAGDRRRAARDPRAILGDPQVADRIRAQVPHQEHDRLHDEGLPRRRDAGADPAPADGRVRGDAGVHRRGGVRRPSPTTANTLTSLMIFPDMRRGVRRGGAVRGGGRRRRRAAGPRLDRRRARSARACPSAGTTCPPSATALLVEFRDGTAEESAAAEALRRRHPGRADPAGADRLHPASPRRPRSTG